MKILGFRWGYMGFAVAGLALSLGAVKTAGAEELTVVGFGGALSAAESEAFDKPFADATGVTILPEVYLGGLAQVKAQFEAGKVTWDVIDSNFVDAELACSEGLLEEIPISALAPGADGSKPKDDFFENALHPCAVANYVWANVYAYDKKAFPNGGPRTIADLFDVEKFPGKRGLRKHPNANLEWALMADGVPMDKVYDVLSTPEGVDRAFAMLDRVKDSAVWWEAGAQPPQLLADGEVVMTTAFNGRLFNAIVKEGQPFEIVWDGQIWDYGAYVIPKGAPNRDRAIEYVRFATSPQQLAEFTKHISYGPARASGVALVPAELKRHLPTADENFSKGIQQSATFWADYGDQLQERFNAWLSGS